MIGEIRKSGIVVADGGTVMAGETFWVRDRAGNIEQQTLDSV